MDHTDLIHICTRMECLKAEGVESSAKRRGNRIHLCCGSCGRRRDYPVEALNRESTGLIEEKLWGFFKVVRRFHTPRSP